MTERYLFKVERADTGDFVGLFFCKSNAKGYIMLYHKNYPDRPMVVKRGPQHRLGETGTTRNGREYREVLMGQQVDALGDGDAYGLIYMHADEPARTRS